MDSKKPQQNFSRQANSKACLSAESNRKSSDLQVNKPWPRNSRRRENPSTSKNDQQRSSKQQQSSAKARTNVDKRPRPRGGGILCNANGSTAATTANEDYIATSSTGLALDDDTPNLGGASYDGARGALGKNSHLDYELNSVYAPGSKKQNLNHLLNFHYAPRESEYSMGINIFGRNGGGGSSGPNRHVYGGKKHKYNKEQFMQANFQFVIKASAKPKLNGSPDTLIDWNLIEQINIQTTEEPQCPICLYPPIAAKLTRCGHAYCWPCILHYLALTDKTWRKCPICYEAIHTADLKSTIIVQQKQIKVGGEITFHLMRRKKGSMFIEKYNSTVPSSESYPLYSTNDEEKLFSKFLIAKRADILDIIDREQRELITDEDPSCPEFVFIQQALDLLKERRQQLGVFDTQDIEEEEEKSQLDDNTSFALQPDAIENTITDEAKINENENEDVPMPSLEVGDKLLSKTGIPTKYYYFYQSIDGQNIYLHPLNVKMLQACYGSLDQAPLRINARILQKEYHSMDEDHRRKFTCLGHLPLTCQFAVVEVDLQPPIITEEILKIFKDDILFRKKERQRRDREERKREKQINEINDRQMGKLIASTANLNLSSSHEFPTFGFEESLISSNNQDASTTRSIDISTPNRQATYSSVAIIRESPKLELWPTLSSPTANSYNSYQELSSWGRSATVARPAASDRSSESGSLKDAAIGSDIDATEFLAPMRTNLGDVLAEALSQKKQCVVDKNTGNTTGANKKSKKSKKMLPLFSTGMNYNGK